MIIRKATTEHDWEQVKSCVIALCAYEKTIRPQRTEFTLESKGPVNFVKENIAKHQGICLLAYENEMQEAIGYLAAWVESGDGLDKGSNKIGWIGDAFVHEEHRGKGIFTSLLELAIKHFHDLGIQRIGTDTLGTNTAMQEILQKRGFTPHKIVYEIYPDLS